MRPFQISQDGIDRSSTLELIDLDKWALLINGCIQIFSSYERAQEVYNILMEG